MKHMFYFLLTTLIIVSLTSCGKALYTPGQLSTSELVSAEAETLKDHGDYWQVEDDIQLYHFSAGEGDRPVLFIHGGPGVPVQEAWRAAEFLADDYVLHFYHQRGCGKSSKPVDVFESKNFYKNMLALDAKLGLSQQLADIERIRRILGEEKLSIIGHSFGGFLASL